jgi:two-component system, sensor histidine kinase and response regulator
MSVFDTEGVPTLNKRTCFLVVDDFETMRKVTINQLRQLGAEKIISAKDGAEALRLLRHEKVDLVLTDWNMPVMDGLALLQAIRTDAKLQALPVIMITAEAERDRVELAIASGVTSMLLKPYSPSQLMARVERGLAWKPRRKPELTGSEPQIAAVSAAPPASPAPRTTLPPTPEPVIVRPLERPSLLVVDDTPDNLMLLSQLFKDEYRVRLAQNGAKALEMCTSATPPDLVLLDVMMPGMDGFEVAKRMREHPTSEGIPVIFVTALTETDARMRGLDLGAVDFISKPIDPEVMKLRVRNFMRYVQVRRQLQADYDNMVESAQLREDVEHITRHDMKGPLAGILGMLQGLMTDKSLGRDQLDQVRLVEETALQVLNMINLSAELYKMETGRFQLKAQPVPIANILSRLAEINRATFSEKQLAIAIDAPPVTAQGDAMLCYSLFQNLLKNACEAAPIGSTVVVSVEDTSPLRINLENSGAVPVAIRERFFDKFVTSGKSGGTGLGTYSARLLTEAQHGSIDLEVDDTRNATRITVSLPRG